MQKNSLLSALFCALIMYSALGQDSQRLNASHVFVIVHIDAMPPYAQAAADLLDSLKYNSLKTKGAKAFTVLQEPGRTNHFTLVEEWADKNAYDNYVAAVYTRQFREKIQPMLGSPFDERIHTELK